MPVAAEPSAALLPVKDAPKLRACAGEDDEAASLPLPLLLPVNMPVKDAMVEEGGVPGAPAR